MKLAVTLPRSCDKIAGMSANYSFSAKLWEWDNRPSWYFVSVPEAEADDIEERFGRRGAGFGSVRVDVTIGATRWTTSLFPSTSEGTYVLPIKKAVRAAEHLGPGATTQVEVTILEG